MTSWAQMNMPPNGISIGLAVFHSTSVTNAQTDTQTTLRMTYVGHIYAIHVRIHAMRCWPHLCYTCPYTCDAAHTLRLAK